MIQIDKDTMAKLQRFAEKNALVEKLSKAGDEITAMDLIDDDYRDLQTELVQEFLPLVNMLANAGLLSVTIDGNGEKFTGNVGGTAGSAFDNGNIHVYAKEVDSYSDRPIAD